MVDDHVAGGSAKREYARRRARDEARLREEWGRFGGIAVALTPEKQSTRAWSTGAAGEEVVGALLDRIASDRVRVLHDRRIRGTRANIDHLVVSAEAVWVIDSKKYKGGPRKDVEGGLFRPRVEKLRIGGCDKTPLVDAVEKQVHLVEETVPGAPVIGVLCFVDADWPLFGGSFSVRDVDVVWPGELGRRIRRPADGSIDVAAVTARLGARFPPS